MRWPVDPPPQAAPGWTLRRVTPASELHGANGVCVGPDDRLYVAQCLGNAVSRLDLNTRAVEPILSLGSPIAGPDDLAFDEHGTMYIADWFGGRVWERSEAGKLRVLPAELPAANGIACEQGRLFVSEYRPSGRLLELSRDGGVLKVLADGLATPNAMAVGADGMIYVPLVEPGEVWRIGLDGERCERFLAGLRQPTAVKFSAGGELTIAEAGSGELTTVSIPSRKRRTLARLDRGIDNLAYDRHGRLFVSTFADGAITEILPDASLREIVSAGFLWPAGIAASADGHLYLADGTSLARIDPHGRCERIAAWGDHGYPGMVRGVAARAGGELLLTTCGGEVCRLRAQSKSFSIIATGLDEAMAVRSLDGFAVAAEAGAGRVIRVGPDGTTGVLADGLARPTGIAIDRSGCYVSEAGAGRIVELRAGSTRVVTDGLREPHGLALADGMLFVVDVGSKELIAVAPGGERSVVARELPVGTPRGVHRTPLAGVADMEPGPVSPFTDVTVGSDGRIYVSADGDGSVLSVSRLD